MIVGVDFSADRLGESGCIGFHRQFIRWMSELAEAERYAVFAFDREIQDYRQLVAPGKEGAVRLLSLGPGRGSLAKRIFVQHFRIPRLFREAGVTVGFSDNIIPFFMRPPVPWAYRVLITQQFHKTLDHRASRRIYRSIATRFAVKRAAVVLPNSNYTLRELRAHCDMTGKRVSVIGDAYDDRSFFPMEKVDLPARLAEEFGLRRPYLLQVSGYVDHKNPLESLKAAARVRRSGLDLDFVLAGGDPLGNLGRYRSFADSLGIGSSVHFLPFQRPPSLRLLYNGAVCFLFPSTWETFGIPPLEAMACGTPVVASDASAVPEVVGDAALRVDPRDTEAFAAGIGRLVGDPDFRAEMIRKGFERCAAFTWEKSLRRMRAEILAAGGSGGPRSEHE
jgi:glycosyltransferase involved in cell wall biosynthesis